MILACDRLAGRSGLTVALSVLVWLLPGAAAAAEIRVRIDDGRRGLSDAVVSLHSSAAKSAVRPRPARMDQRGSQFTPRVLTVQAGSAVTFPNSDNIRHNVYSFSPAKRFELPLYSGHAAPPLRFDVPGVVALGCNIHDWMVGYIVVLDTPYSAITDAGGNVTLQAPAGDYSLQVWHPQLPAGTPVIRRKLSLGAAGASERISLRIATAPAVVPVPPSAADARVRALQEKLRSLKRDR